MTDKQKKAREKFFQMHGTTASSPGGSESKTASRKQDAREKFLQMHNQSQVRITKSGNKGDEKVLSFFTDVGDYLRESTDPNKRNSWQSVMDEQKSATRTAVEDAWDQRVKDVRTYLKKNKGDIDADVYTDIQLKLSHANYNIKKIKKANAAAKDYFSQFESEEDYNQQMKALQDYEAMMSYDTDKARREIAWLEIKRDKILAEDAGRFAPVSYTDNGLPVFNPFRANASTEALDKEISQKKAYLTQVERLQEGVRLGSVGNKDSENYDEEYDYYANQRNFGIPTAEDLNTYDKMMDQTTWRTDSEGRLFDAYGKEIDPNKRDEQGRIIHPNQDKYDTTDKLGIFLSADAGEIEDAASRYVTTGATWDTILGEGKEKNWDQMDENEISNYYYYLNKFGEEAANDYLSSIQESLNQRKGFERAKAMEDNVALELLFGVEAGFDQFSSGITGVRNAVLGEDDYVPVTSTQFASQKVREDLADADLPVWYNFKTGKWESKILGSSVGQTAYDTITTTSNMLPSILTSTAVGLINPTAGAAVGTGLMGASAAGNAYTEMINLGYDVGQARTYAALVGGSEIALESLLGGISKLGGGAATKGITKLLGKADNAFAKIAIKFGNTPVGKVLINALEEGSEEYWQSILEPIFQNAILGTENEIDLFSEEALYSALLGAITGGMFEGADVGTQRAVQNYNTDLIGKEISRTEGGVDALKALAMDVAGANTKLTKQAGKVSSEAATGTGFGKVIAALKNSANQKKVGKLYQSVQQQVNKSNVSDIAAALESKGYTKQNAKNIADAVVAQMSGKELDAFQANVLKAYGSKELGETINELLSDDNSSIVKRTTDTSAFDVGIALGKGIAPASTQEVNSTEMKVSEDGKTKDSSGNEIPIKFADNGQIATESGNVGVEDVEFASHREAYIVESISALNLPAKAANTLFESINVKSMTDTQATDFVTGIQKAYELGRENNLAELPTHPLTKNLTSQQRMEAYSAGLGVRNKETADRQKAASSRKADKAKKGGVYFRGNDQQVSSIDSVLIRRKGSLDAKQVSGIYTMKYLSKAIGTEFYVFESYKKDRAQYFVDEDGVEKKAPNGWYDPTTGRIYIDLNAGQTARGTMLFTIAHELTHFIRQNSPAKFDALADIVVNKSNLKGKVSERIEQKLKEAKDRREPISRDAAYEEVIADSMETILTSGRVLEMMNEVKKQDKTLWEQIRDWFVDFIKSIREAYSGVDADTVEGQAIAEMDDVLKELEQVFAEGLVDAGENYTGTFAPGSEGVVVNERGDPVAYSNEQGSVMLSMRTYEEDGRQALRQYLQKCVTNESLTSEEMQEMMDGIEDIYSVCKEFKDKYAPFSAWSDAAVVRDTYGKPVFSVVTPNGEYKMNLDFSLVCKKRRTLDAVFNEMSKRGIIDDFELGQKSVVKINEIIRKHGLETACALCFVDAKRFRQASMADSFTSLYNELVESLVPEEKRTSIEKFNFAGYDTIRKVENGIHTWSNAELDFSHLNEVMKNYGSGTVEHKAAKYIKAHPEGRKLLLRGDFMSSKGFDAVKTQNPSVLKLYNSKKGTGGPKAAFGDVQYMNEIIKKARTWTPAKAYSVGGVRIQSFSDYVPRMVFDYVQMIYDLAATKLPAHAYTKEALFVKQFGLTGIKINMSLIPAIAEGGIAPGLDADGNYVWAGESFDYETAKEIQNTDGYTENCGTICVGVSKDHILKLLRDPNIRMVIPYHKSGLNPIVAHMNKIAEFHDYTNDQRTKGKDGKALAKDFDFNKALHDMGENANPKALADQYLKWCVSNGFTPKFAEFAAEENYYKLIEDFTLYDKDGKYVPQREVRAVFPKEGSAFGSMKDLIKAGLEEDAIIEGKRDSSLSSIVDEIQKTLPRSEAEISEEQVTQADRDLEAAIQGIETDVHTDDVNAIAEQVTDVMNTRKFSNRDSAHRDETYSAIGKELLAYEVREAIQSRIIDNPEIKYSDRNTAPTFYSHMAKVVDGVKQTKLGASSVVNMLRGKGVKAEEIKWSGIETWLEGKKSVTKAELQEFIAGSMLQIEEEILDNKDRPYSEDQQKRLDEYEAKRDEVAKRLADEWKKITGEEFPVRNPGAGLESTVVNKIIDANKEHKDAAFEGRLLKKLRNDLKEVIGNNDDFGFDSWKDALRSIHRHRRDFINNYEMSTNDKAVIVKYCNALNAYNELPTLISEADTDRLRAIARETDPWNRKIMEVKHEHNEEEAKYMTNWGQYRLEGGKNYREMLFRIPGSTYSNEAMFTHWKDRTGVLAHARVQDIDTFIGKMLFIEEIQSDWHNEGHKEGYRKEGEKTDYMLRTESKKAYEEFYTAVENMVESNANWEDDNAVYYVHPVVVAEMFEGNESYFEQYGFTDEQRENIRSMVAEEAARQEALKTAPKQEAVPDAPFKDNYHEYVLKRLLREAAEQDYDSIGWTTAETQDDRWQNNMPHKEGTGKSGFLKAYTIEYDQNIRNFLDKFGKKWGTRVGKTVLDNGTEVWSMAITDSMKDSVLTEGQPLYSDRDSKSVSNRSLLANALEGVAQNEWEQNKLNEYKENIAKVEEMESRLQEINSQLYPFGKKMPQKERIALQDEAVGLRNKITNIDKKLLRLEAAKPLQNVLNRERARVRREMKQKAEERISEVKAEAAQRLKRRSEGHAATEMRKKIRKTIRELDKILNRGDKKRNVKEDMKDFVTKATQSAELLFKESYPNEDILREGFQRVNLRPSEQVHYDEARKIMEQIQTLGTSYDTIDEITKLRGKLDYRISKLREAFDQERMLLNETRVADVLNNLAGAYAELKNSEYSYIVEAYNEQVHEHLASLAEEMGGATIRSMTMSQLEDLYKAYRMVLETVRNSNKVFNENIKLTRQQVSEEVIREILAQKKRNPLWSKAEISRNKFFWNNLKPIYATERVGSQTFAKVMNGLFEGQYKWATNVEAARNFQREISQKYKANGWDMNTSYSFTSSSGLDFELNLGQILSLYAYSKRDAAHDHITHGGIVFDKNTEVKIKENGIPVTRLKREATTYSISDEILGEILSKLTPEQKLFVDDMQKYLSETMGGLGNEVSMKLYGVKLFGEENYFPLKSAGQYMEKAREADLKKDQGHTSLVNAGFTHAVKPNAKNPIIINSFMDVWANHVNDMAMYNGMVLPMEDFRKVYNFHTPFYEGTSTTSVNGALENAFGNEAVKYFDQLYQELNSGAVTDPRESDMLKWVSKFKKASVMLSMSVVMQQPSAIGRAFALVDPKYFVGEKITESEKTKQWDELKKYAPVAIIKEMGGFDTHMGASAKDYILSKEYSKEEIKDALLNDKQYRKETWDMISGYLPAKADEITWVAIWQAVKRETKAINPHLTGEEFFTKAGQRFSEVIEKTQVYDSVLARSANMRSKTIHMTMATAFMAEPTTTINMVEIALRSKKNVGRVLASVVTSIVINNFLASWVYAARDDDEDETFLEKYAQAFTSGLVDDLNPITYYPFVKDIWSLFQGYDVERGDMSVIADVSDALKKAVQIIGKDTSEMNEEQLAKHHAQTWDAILTLADGVASVCGIPAKNVRREISAGINTVKTLTNGLGFSGTSLANAIGDSALDALPVANYLWMPDKADRLYTAIKNGDTDYVNRLKQEYGDDTKVSKAIQKGLKENDPRIYEAALKDIAGLPADRLKLQKEVMADGFSWEDVRNATVSIINNLTPDAAKAAPKKHGYYETDDFVTFIAKGQTTYANEAKKDIIATHQLNGKTEDEAVKAFDSSVKTELKKLFLSGGISVATAEHALVTYLDMSKSDANTQVNKWNYEKTTGTEYSDKREEFLAGTLSAKDLMTALKTVEGKTDKEAASMLISYTRDAYDEGRFSKSKAREIMMTYGNLTAEQADSKLRYIDIKKQFPDTYVDDNWVDEYYDEVESSGISLGVFVEYRNKVKGITGEGKKKQRMAVINSLPITKAQKDALYFAEGWAKSTLYEAPWR